MPDNAFDLAVVDPPYGGGFTETGGCKGWFSKYHQEQGESRSQTLNVERERQPDCDATAVTDGIDTTKSLCKSDCRTVTRTGGTWATKYAKKS